MTPHLEKLLATLANEKLPETDKPRLEAAIQRYQEWLQQMQAVTGHFEQKITKLVQLLNEYRYYLDIELIFDSSEDFLYRQKGQLKLDNSVLEEFLPHLFKTLPELANLPVQLGPIPSFSSIYFKSSLDTPIPGGGLSIKTKNQDFSIAKPLYLKASHSPFFEESTVQAMFLSYVAVECKTNLDKTMFQEACATAHDTKSAVIGSRYYLLCEWLDMAPQSTAATDIDEILILRKAKRLNANIRAQFSTAEKRKKLRHDYVTYWREHPFQPEIFARLLFHIQELIRNEQPEEQNVLAIGYF